MLIFLLAAVVAVPFAKKIGLGSILGYLIAGAILGPFGAQLFSNVSGLMHLSEFGVVFLLFVIGLELKPARLWVMRKSVFGIGGTQVLLGTLVLSAASFALGLDLKLSLIVGFALSLSSTAFALQYLGERKQLTTEYGRSAFAVLLFQDVAVIPVLAILPLLFVGLGTESALPPWVGILVVIAILTLGRHVTRPIFRMIASSRSREVFTSVTLLMVLGVAALMQTVGLSMALGSFLVGVLLSDSEYRHELETDIEPFKGLLMGLFFMSVGMMINTELLVENPLRIFGLLLLYLVLKFSSLFLTGKIFRFSNETSRHLSFSIVQGSEFAFVIVSLLLQGNILGGETADTVILMISLSMAMTPLLGIFNDRVLSKAFQSPPKPFDEIDDEHPLVIVAGLGRVGQIVTRILRIKDIPFTALEQDPEQVETLRRFGNKVYYGDASRIDLLEKAGAPNAKYFILAIDDVESSVHTAEVVKQTYPHLKIIARARNRNHAFRLKDIGVHLMERETFWSSIQMTRALLMDWGEDEKMVDKTLNVFTKHDLEMLEGQYQRQNDREELISYSKQAGQQLVEVMRDDKKCADPSKC
ncbi:MAG: glutathione-regulated potassium-efflux system protein KefB [Bdellovibrio sp. CG10_big_fil_rev_8_21_14_0_10_47_8]|nr:MAG: glutathione-regulated potassium-efflux system protein KefB [Bdellovibrio sp. CG10_big_fil_rev_8_21_14_0_10_47_8]